MGYLLASGWARGVSWLLSTLLWAGILQSRPARADDAEAPSLRYSAPAECPPRERFIALLQRELGSEQRPVPRLPAVELTISSQHQGYVAAARLQDAHGEPLERQMQANSCDELLEIAATIVALGQRDDRSSPQNTPQPPTTKAAQTGPVALRTHQPKPATRHRRRNWDDPSAFGFATPLGFTYYLGGPPSEHIASGDEFVKVGIAQGVRFGWELEHGSGWWLHSLQVGFAIYDQRTTRMRGVESKDQSRTLLQVTADACPLHFDYSYSSPHPEPWYAASGGGVSIRPCIIGAWTKSTSRMGVQEWALGGLLRVRTPWRNGHFFVEGALGLLTAEPNYETGRHLRWLYTFAVGGVVP